MIVFAVIFALCALLALMGLLHDLIWEKDCEGGGGQLIFIFGCIALAVVSLLI